MTRRLRSLAAAALLAVAGAAAFLPTPSRAQVTADDQADLARVQQYLNSITTVQARFTQVSSTAGSATGTFSLSRPGRMRIEYDPPVPYLYVADGLWLTFWDDELKQRSDVPLGSTLADFITRRNIRLSGDVTVTDLQRGDGLILVTLVQSDDPASGQMTLVFNDNPLSLRSWRVLDAQGATTEVLLQDAQYGVSLPNRLFTAPRR